MKEIAQAGASVLGGVLNLIGQKKQSQFQEKQQEREFQHSKEMSEYAYSKELEQWERANLYNAPTQQMARLRDAGLNPAMIYGSGGAKTVAAQSPKYQAPRPQYTATGPHNIGAAIGQFQSLAMAGAQVDLLREQTNSKKIEQAIGLARLPGIKGDSAIKSELGKYAFNLAFQENRKKTFESGMASIQRRRINELLDQSRIATKRDRIGLKIKGLDLKYKEWLNQAGIAGKVGIPILRMLLGQ